MLIRLIKDFGNHKKGAELNVEVVLGHRLVNVREVAEKVIEVPEPIVEEPIVPEPIVPEPIVEEPIVEEPMDEEAKVKANKKAKAKAKSIARVNAKVKAKRNNNK